MAITKIDLAERISGEMGLTRREASASVDSLFEIIKDELSKGNPVKISGFGKWSILSKNARRGRNPQTGENITIDARKVLTFKGSVVLRDAINSQE